MVNPNNKRTPFKNAEVPYPEKIDPVNAARCGNLREEYYEHYMENIAGKGR